MIILPNNRLILNGHRITNTKQLFEYLSKKFKTDINCKEDFLIFEKYNLAELSCYMNNNSISFSVIQLDQEALGEELSYVADSTSGDV